MSRTAKDARQHGQALTCTGWTTESKLGLSTAKLLMAADQHWVELWMFVCREREHLGRLLEAMGSFHVGVELGVQEGEMGVR